MNDFNFYANLNKEFNFSDEEFLKLYSDLDDLIDTLAVLVNIIWQEKIKDHSWKYFAETLGIRIIQQLSTLKQLFLGTELNFSSFQKNVVIIDIPTLYSILRSLIENYLTLFYLFIDNISPEERRARWIIYELSGLKSREKILDPRNESKVKTDKLNEEKNQILSLQDELRKNNFYINLDQEIKKKVKRYNKAKLKEWSEIFKDSELNPSFQRVWKFYSNYVHVEYLSLMQVKDYWAKPEDTLHVRNMELFHSLIISSIVIVDFRKLYKEIDIQYSHLDMNSKRVINLLYGLGKYAI